MGMLQVEWNEERLESSVEKALNGSIPEIYHAVLMSIHLSTDLQI